jgi:hypothetical protein
MNVKAEIDHLLAATTPSAAWTSTRSEITGM